MSAPAVRAREGANAWQIGDYLLEGLPMGAHGGAATGDLTKSMRILSALIGLEEQTLIRRAATRQRRSGCQTWRTCHDGAPGEGCSGGRLCPPVAVVAGVPRGLPVVDEGQLTAHAGLCSPAKRSPPKRPRGARTPGARHDRSWPAMRINRTPTMVHRAKSSDRTADAEQMVLVLAEHTDSDAPEAVRHALAVLAASLGDPAADVIRAGLLGWDAEDGLLPDVIAWT